MRDIFGDIFENEPIDPVKAARSHLRRPLRRRFYDEVIIAEGEKDVDRICSLNLSELHPGTRVAATTNFHGAGPGKWHDYYSLYLAGKDVVILPDNDEVGRAHAEEIARSAAKYANGVKVVHLPGLDEHGDVSDYLDSHSRE